MKKKLLSLIIASCLVSFLSSCANPSTTTSETAQVTAAPTTEQSESTEVAEKKTEFDVELTEVGPNKVQVIKVVREVTGLDLKDAKEIVDGAPKVLKEAVSQTEADDIKAKLEAEGAKITLE